MATAQNKDTKQFIMDNKGCGIEDQMSDLYKLNEFLGDGSIYNHPMQLDSQPLNPMREDSK